MWESGFFFECEFGYLENVHEYHTSSEANLRSVKNHLWKTARQLFREKEKLVSGQTETAGIRMINFQDLRCVSTSLLHCRAYQYFTTNAYVLRLCTLFGKRWETILLNPGRAKFNSTVFGQHLFQRFESNWWTTYGIRVEYFPRTHHSGNPESVSTDDERITVWTRELHRQDHLHINVQRHCTGFQSKWWNMWKQFKDNEKVCWKIPSRSLVFPRARIWKKKWYGTYDCKPDGSWDRTAEKMLQNFAGSGHPIFRGTSALEGG